MNYRVWHIRLSSSSWGCELKYWYIYEKCISESHPPREDVSWNLISLAIFASPSCHPPREDVSWNIAIGCLWNVQNCHPPREDVSWNSLGSFDASWWYSHPPREDVSWNAWKVLFGSNNWRSSSSWGCELKYDCKRCHKSSYKLSCLWCLEYIGYSNKNCKIVYEVAI